MSRISKVLFPRIAQLREENVRLNEELEFLRREYFAVRDEDLQTSLIWKNSYNKLAADYDALVGEKNKWMWEAESLQREQERLAAEFDTLHGEKNKWVWEAAALQREQERLAAEFDTLHGEKNKWMWEAAALQRGHDYFSERRLGGYLHEFDYPYAPRKREFIGLDDGNVFLSLIEEGKETQGKWLRASSNFINNFQLIEVHNSAESPDPCWNNGWFAPLDGIFLYTLLAVKNPRLYIEVGSGNSTKFARRAISDHSLRTRIVSIDPYPRAFIDSICDTIVRQSLEAIDLSLFNDLSEGDLLFIDNSHRAFPGSDVTVFFTEILPILSPGVTWGVHDIFLPNDYPEEWRDRMYNEQYLLMAYLLGGARGDKIEIPVAHVARTRDLMDQYLSSNMTDPPWESTRLDGGAFWMTRS